MCKSAIKSCKSPLKVEAFSKSASVFLISKYVDSDSLMFLNHTVIMHQFPLIPDSANVRQELTTCKYKSFIKTLLREKYRTRFVHIPCISGYVLPVHFSPASKCSSTSCDRTPPPATCKGARRSSLLLAVRGPPMLPPATCREWQRRLRFSSLPTQC